MRIFCIKCGALVPARDVNIFKSLAKCKSCNSVFDLKEAMERRGPREAGRARPIVPLPENYQLEVIELDPAEAPGSDLGPYRAPATAPTAPQLKITRRWHRPVHRYMLLFFILWDIASSLVLLRVLLAPTADLMRLILPASFLGLGLYMTYFALALVINRTWITVQQDFLSIRHGPLPWPGKLHLARNGIAQLFVERRGADSDETMATYTLSAVRGNGKKVLLVQDLATPEQAVFLEQEIEIWFGIKDRAVVGEYR